jgi:hypothetical protein
LTLRLSPGLTGGPRIKEVQCALGALALRLELDPPDKPGVEPGLAAGQRSGPADHFDRRKRARNALRALRAHQIFRSNASNQARAGIIGSAWVHLERGGWRKQGRSICCFWMRPAP